jgi:competence protein ComEA
MHLDRIKQMALVGAAAALGIAAFILLRAGGGGVPEPALVATPAAPAQIKVDVVGEVVWPGLYVLGAGARVQDAIFAAHGPTYIADLKRVNLAAVLRDGDRVVIPRIIQPTYPFSDAPMSATLGARPTTPPKPSKASPAGETLSAVNVNTATAADLERLPGVGPVLARRIVEHREARGLFRRLDDLLEVEGIGPKLFRRLKPLLRLDEGTAPTPPP